MAKLTQKQLDKEVLELLEQRDKPAQVTDPAIALQKVLAASRNRGAKQE